MATEPQPGRLEGVPSPLAEQTQELAQMADAARLSVVWVRGEQPAGVWAARENSLCRFFQNRAETAPLCAGDCGAMAAQTSESQPTRCHAGLYVIRAALPGQTTQALVGGRAFVTRADYQALTKRFQTGDLQDEFAPELFRNLNWTTPGQLTELGRKLASWAALLRESSGTTAPEVLVEPLTKLSEPLTTLANVEHEEVIHPSSVILHPFGVAVWALAGACELRRAVLLWPDGERFAVAYKLGAWAGEVAVSPQDARLFLAGETKSSLVLAEKDGVWRPREEVAGDAPLAELFPFLSGTEIKAALLVASDALDDAKRRAVATFGRAAALPLEVFHLRQVAAQRARWTNSATQLAARLNAPGQADDYQPIVAQSAQIFHSQRVSLMIYEETEGVLAIKASIGLPPEVVSNTRLRLGEGVAGRALAEGRVLLADNAGASTFISYPIFIGGRPGGVLNLTERAGGLFDESDVRLLDFLAPQLALALDRAEWREKALRFRYMSVTDPLTGLANRRYLMARLAEEVSRVARRHEPLSFMMLDLDNFKHYNDQNGHQAGDEALILLAQCLHSNLRGADVAARYGGEEFSILLPQTTLQEARAIGERIQWQVAETVFPHGQRQPGGAVTVSIGVADYAPGRTTPEAIIKAADQALYQAKSLGKDLVQVYKE